MAHFLKQAIKQLNAKDVVGEATLYKRSPHWMAFACSPFNGHLFLFHVESIFINVIIGEEHTHVSDDLELWPTRECVRDFPYRIG